MQQATSIKSAYSKFFILSHTKTRNNGKQKQL